MSDTVNPIFGEWIEFFDEYILGTPEFQQLENELTELYFSSSSKCMFYPEVNNIFKAFQICPPNKCKVVFIGQDPYPDGSATGIAFAQAKGSMAPSLAYIMKAIENDYSCELEEFDTTLETWAKQGVLLLNASLTVAHGKPNSHKALWEPVMRLILDKLPEYILKLNNHGLIYVTVGGSAKEYISEYALQHFVRHLHVYHPAYEARKPSTHAFSKSGIFKDINDWLVTGTLQPIDWLKDSVAKFNNLDLFNHYEDKTEETKSQG